MQWRCREFGTQKIQHSVDHNHHHHHYHHRIEERKKTRKGERKKKTSSGFRSADHRGTTSNAIAVNVEC